MRDIKEMYIDTEGVTLLIVCNSKEERDQMTKDLESGMLGMIEWHKVKTRPMTEEELEEAAVGSYGDELVMLDCLLPEDGEEILIAYRKTDGLLAVGYDTCAFDGEGYYLENNGDFTEIEYWAKLPYPPQDPKAEEEET